MKWVLLFWLWQPNGHLFAHDRIHGFAHRGDCVVFARAIPPERGRVEWQCVRERGGGLHPFRRHAKVRPAHR